MVKGLIIACLIALIGMIPIVLAICLIKIYKGSELATALLLYMLFISFWQLDVAVLYLKGVISKDLITFLFRLFRLGPTFLVPIVFYLAYILIKNIQPILRIKEVISFYYPFLTEKYCSF